MPLKKRFYPVILSDIPAANAYGSYVAADLSGKIINRWGISEITLSDCIVRRDLPGSAVPVCVDRKSGALTGTFATNTWCKSA